MAVSPLMLSPRTPDATGLQQQQIKLESPWTPRGGPSGIQSLAAAPPPPFTPDTPSFLHHHHSEDGIVHSTPAYATRSVTNPPSPRRFQLEQYDVMARSLVHTKAERDELKRKCGKLQRTIDRMRDESGRGDEDEEEEPWRGPSTSRRNEDRRRYKQDSGSFLDPRMLGPRSFKVCATVTVDGGSILTLYMLYRRTKTQIDDL